MTYGHAQSYDVDEGNRAAADETYTHVEFFFFNDATAAEIYALSLPDALPIDRRDLPEVLPVAGQLVGEAGRRDNAVAFLLQPAAGSDGHTPELQQLADFGCRPLVVKGMPDRTKPGLTSYTVVHAIPANK